MSLFIPLQKSVELDEYKIGKRAVYLAQIQKDINLPFSMIITKEAFDEFVKYNQLSPELEWFRNAKTTKEKIESFQRLSVAMKIAQFPEYLVPELRECFELVTLDTNKLSSLSIKNETNHIISLTRSVNYDDSLNHVSEIILSRETFKQFIETIKKIYLSAFTPSTNLVENYSVAVIVSRTPKLKVCVEVELNQENNQIFVNSYYGFFDYSKSVERDIFKIKYDFLKIEEKTIIPQRKVVVFDPKENNLFLKEFSEENSSQSLTDQTILETARLTKQIGKITNKSKVQAKYFVDENNNIILIGLDCLKAVNYKEPKIIENNVKSENIINTKEDVIFNPVEIKQAPKLNEIIDSEEMINLIKCMKSFVEKNKNPKINSIKTILDNALENPDKYSLIQYLDLCKNIIEDFRE